MTVGDYLDDLMRLGMGWLGWTEADTLDTSMPAIMMAYEGRKDMLQRIFGSGEAKPEPQSEPEAVTADDAAPTSLTNRLKSAFRSLTNERGDK